MSIKKYVDLYDAILLLENKEEVEKFLLDLCTPNELKDLNERWQVCQTLDFTDLSYRQIHKELKVSLTTIGRVARFLRDEKNFGYKKILEKIKGIKNEKK